jgi:hypothetical protein
MSTPTQLLASFARRVSGRAKRQRRTEELDDELAFHTELVEREFIERGMSSSDAHDAARRRVGNRTRIREQSWDVWSFGVVESAMRQLRLAFRAARKSAGYSITVVLTLALGIGATVTIFSVVDHVLIRPLAYPDADRLMVLYEHGAEGNWRLVSYPTLLDWSHASAGFSAMAYVRGNGESM